jgi:pyridoxamine 5'-phosphate oxidase
LRFLTYRSGDPIDSLEALQNRYNAFESQYQNQKIPMGDSYCGYRLVPKRIYFYTLGQNTFSQVVQYVLNEEKWEKQLISP